MASCCVIEGAVNDLERAHGTGAPGEAIARAGAAIQRQELATARLWLDVLDELERRDTARRGAS